MRLHDHLTRVTGIWPGRPNLTGRTLRGEWLHPEDVGCFDEERALFVTGEIVCPAEAENAPYRRGAVADAAVAGEHYQRPGQLVHALTAPATGERLGPAEMMPSARGAGPAARTCAARRSAAC